MEIPSFQNLAPADVAKQQHVVLQDGSGLPGLRLETAGLRSLSGDAPCPFPVSTMVGLENGNSQSALCSMNVELSVSGDSGKNSTLQSQDLLLAFKCVAEKACQDNGLMQAKKTDMGLVTWRRKGRRGVLTRSRARSVDVVCRMPND